MPQVHDRDKQGLATCTIAPAREKGIPAYIGAGLNRWAAVHRLDAAPVYRLALEKGSAGAGYHAVAEEGVSVRETAGAIGRGLQVQVVALSPEEAAGRFGRPGSPVGMDSPASSAPTQQRPGWHPTEKPGFIAGLERPNGFGA